jgi:hypothetical protein
MVTKILQLETEIILETFNSREMADCDFAVQCLTTRVRNRQYMSRRRSSERL